jgi:hypothetical protein
MPRRAIFSGLARDVLPLKRIVAPRRFEELGQQIEAGGLAGAVRADQRVDMPAPDLQVDVVDGDEAANSLTRPVVSRMQSSAIKLFS